MSKKRTAKKVSPAKKRKQKRVQCPHCDRWFGNAGAEGRHETTAHSADNPEWAEKVRKDLEEYARLNPPPKITVEEAPNDLEEYLTLTGAGSESFQVGDSFKHVRQFVILKTERVEGKKSVKVLVKCTRRHWENI